MLGNQIHKLFKHKPLSLPPLAFHELLALSFPFFFFLLSRALLLLFSIFCFSFPLVLLLLIPSQEHTRNTWLNSIHATINKSKHQLPLMSSHGSLAWREGTEILGEKRREGGGMEKGKMKTPNALSLFHFSLYIIIIKTYI